MKRYLIRAGMTPFESIPIERIIARNYIGYNSGNLIYQSSVMRALMTSGDVEFVPDRYLLDQQDAIWVNENYDAYIITLADAFRPNTGDLKRITRLVRKLDIPCVVVGVGLRCEPYCEPTEEHPFDEDVRRFMSAVLERSSTVGIRGHTTAAYLANLGYRENEHFRVIGCPSMYLNGAVLPRRELSLTSESHINVTMNSYSNIVANEFLLNILATYPNSTYTAQRIEELCTLYLAEMYTGRIEADTERVAYPRHITDRLYAQDKVHFFLTVKQWMDHLSRMDLSIGGRMHGNVAAIQVGCPVAFIAKDRRMMELAEYHALPHIFVLDVDPNWSLEEFLARLDREAMYRVHPSNFETYLSFLEENDLESIFADNPSPAVGSTAFDRAIESTTQEDIPESAVHIEAEELASRWRSVVDETKAYRIEIATRQVAKTKVQSELAKKRAVDEAIARTVYEMKLPRRIARKFGLR